MRCRACAASWALVLAASVAALVARDDDDCTEVGIVPAAYFPTLGMGNIQRGSMPDVPEGQAVYLDPRLDSLAMPEFTDASGHEVRRNFTWKVLTDPTTYADKNICRNATVEGTLMVSEQRFTHPTNPEICETDPGQCDILPLCGELAENDVTKLDQYDKRGDTVVCFFPFDQYVQGRFTCILLEFVDILPLYWMDDRN